MIIFLSGKNAIWGNFIKLPQTKKCTSCIFGHWLDKQSAIHLDLERFKHFSFSYSLWLSSILDLLYESFCNHPFSFASLVFDLKIVVHSFSAANSQFHPASMSHACLNIYAYFYGNVDFSCVHVCMLHAWKYTSCLCCSSF